MRAFKEYLTESTKTYMFRVRVADELSKDRLDKVKKILDKYSLSAISEPKRLPIQQKTFGFEHLNNPEVNVVDVVTNYPCTPQEVQSAFNSAGIALGRIMITTTNQEVLIAPAASEAGEGKAVLDKDLPKSTYPQMLADLENALASKESSKYQYTYAGEKTKSSKTSNDLPQGNQSPVGSKQNKIPNPYKK